VHRRSGSRSLAAPVALFACLAGGCGSKRSAEIAAAMPAALDGVRPAALARYVLRDDPAWDNEAIKAAMYSGEERHVKLDRPLPVHIVYFTAWPDASGAVRFYDDVYGWDGRLSGIDR
jgi:hypothetical protein